jgi:hypothetical protein
MLRLILLEQLFAAGNDVILDGPVEGREEGAVACHPDDHPLVFVRVFLRIQ